MFFYDLICCSIFLIGFGYFILFLYYIWLRLLFLLFGVLCWGHYFLDLSDWLIDWLSDSPARRRKALAIVEHCHMSDGAVKPHEPGAIAHMALRRHRSCGIAPRWRVPYDGALEMRQSNQIKSISQMKWNEIKSITWNDPSTRRQK